MILVSEGRQLISPPITDFWSFWWACCQAFNRRRGLLEYLPYECHQGLGLKWFRKKWELPSVDAVSCQILLDIAGHEDYSQVFPYAKRADGQFVAMHVGELIGA